MFKYYSAASHNNYFFRIDRSQGWEKYLSDQMLQVFRAFRRF